MSLSILGISAFYHDSAAAVVKDGQIVAAAQEERFTRIKHDHNFPKHAVDYCLQEASLIPEQLDYVVFYDKPFLKFDRLMPEWMRKVVRHFDLRQESVSKYCYCVEAIVFNQYETL